MSRLFGHPAATLTAATAMSPFTNLRLLSLFCLATPLVCQGGGAENDLRVAAKKGSTVWLLLEEKQEQTIDMGGQTMDIENMTTRTLQVEVKDVDDKGNLTVEVKIARIHGSMTMPMGMGDVEFDSAKKTEGEEAEDGDADDGPPVILEDVAGADHDTGRQRQRQVHRREHALERRNHEDQQHGDGDTGDRENHRGVDHRALHLAYDRVVLFQERREAEQNRVENTARFTRGDHVDVQIGERLRMLAQRVGERVTALDVVHDLARDVGQNLVFGLLRQNVERLHERQAGVDHGRELAGEDRQVLGADRHAAHLRQLESALGPQ